MLTPLVMLSARALEPGDVIQWAGFDSPELIVSSKIDPIQEIPAAYFHIVSIGKYKIGQYMLTDNCSYLLLAEEVNENAKVAT